MQGCAAETSLTFRVLRIGVKSAASWVNPQPYRPGGQMIRRHMPTLLIAAMIASNAFSATGNLTVFDDSDENGFDHPGATCSSGTTFFGESAVFHSGNAAIAITKDNNNGAGWVAPATYSTSADYDGISFWINAGNNPTTTTSLAVFDQAEDEHFLHLEDIYGAPLPANTWIQFQIPFSSPFFEAASSTPPATLATVCVIFHFGGAGANEFLYLDDVALTGADIFKDGFGN